MCILCVAQRLSRRVATMLPWLVIPLIMLWALSQLLPPGLRFEITSPRLACVMVLLATLFWYEILMPQLSAWWARRTARLRERHRIEALELQKLRKIATRRCRNCHAPYRDQNPGGGGRFMCSNCGHVSKRPVLDIPEPAGRSGFIGELVGKSGWISAEGNRPLYWAAGAGRDDSRCSTERSYSGVFVLACRLLLSFLFGVKWLWSKVLRVCSSRRDGSSDAENNGLSSRRGENGDGFQESRGEKTRRKAEEKRLARLEKEMLEEEERKQREEVARLVEERRKLRDEILEAEKQHSRGPAHGAEKGGRKETEKRRQDRRKEKDKGSTKSSSDGEDPEKSTDKESGRKLDFERKSEHERCNSQRTTTENQKMHGSEHGDGNKAATNKTKYFDRVKGSFFGRNTQNTSGIKASKPAVATVDRKQTPAHTRDSHSTVHVNGKQTQNGDHIHVGSDMQPKGAVLKKSWHQLFTRSSSVSPYPDTSISSYSNHNIQRGAPVAPLTDLTALPSYSVDDQNNCGPPSPSAVYPSLNDSVGRNSVSHSKGGYLHPFAKEPVQGSISEEAEVFEDPCYVPDPISLLGPVSKSIDNFPRELGVGFATNNVIEGPCFMKKMPTSIDASKPSPIEPPISRSRSVEEKRTASCQAIGTLKSQQAHTSGSVNSNKVHEQGTWQMWSPLAHDGLGLVGSSWFSPQGQNESNKVDGVYPFSHNPIVSQIAREKDAIPVFHHQRSVPIGNHQNGGSSPLGLGLNGSGASIKSAPFQSSAFDGETHFLPLNLIDNISLDEAAQGSSDNSIAAHRFKLPPADCWSKEDWAVHGLMDAENSISARPHVGGLFSANPDEHSVWSYN